MSGARVAAFSKYFAIGGLCAALACARHSAFLIADDSVRFQQVCASVARYASEVAALEEYLGPKGLPVAQIQSSANLPWPPTVQ
ncbi:hypothetical protein LSCM1_05579 [Leishmania martiniquensis]|uniref:Uncharacterized protein n=1 Tax=Leishmania martiniquensis TaxID=1580590 RepID=A0A836GGE7_9TRYP|nr:hypothetical protein LSCM1_05579 [Leishmania martiniquensis]